MIEYTYVIAVDASDDRVDHDGLRSLIRDNPDFTAWWNHIPSFYLIQTRLTPDEISELVDRHTNRAKYLVMRVDPEASQGLLPKRSWAWLNRREAVAEEEVNRKRTS